MINQQRNRPRPHLNMRKAASLGKRVLTGVAGSVAVITPITAAATAVVAAAAEKGSGAVTGAAFGAVLGAVSGAPLGLSGAIGFSYVHDIKIDPSNNKEKAILFLLNAAIAGGSIQAFTNDVPYSCLVAGLSSTAMLCGMYLGDDKLAIEGVDPSRIQHEYNGAVAPLPQPNPPAIELVDIEDQQNP